MAYFLLFLRRMPDTNNAMSAARDAASTIESKTIGELSPVTAATRTFEFEPEAPLFVLLVIVLPVILLENIYDNLFYHVDGV